MALLEVVNESTPIAEVVAQGGNAVPSVATPSSRETTLTGDLRGSSPAAAQFDARTEASAASSRVTLPFTLGETGTTPVGIENAPPLNGGAFMEVTMEVTPMQVNTPAEELLTLLEHEADTSPFAAGRAEMGDAYMTVRVYGSGHMYRFYEVMGDAWGETFDKYRYGTLERAYALRFVQAHIRQEQEAAVYAAGMAVVS